MLSVQTLWRKWQFRSSVEGSASKTGTRYYPAFDYLRIVLATVVAVGHAGIPIWKESGNLAVQIFFAMSGWLIGGILLNSTPKDLPRFYFNRAARIWVPYFVAIILLMIVSLLKEPVTAKWLEFFFYKITFVYNFFGPPQIACCKLLMPLDGTGNHFWSIAAEEQFYLVAPFLLAIIPTSIGRTIWFWVLIALAANISIYWGYFGSISLGVLAAVVHHNAYDWHTGLLARRVMCALAIILFISTYFSITPYRIGAPLFSISIVLLLAQPGGHSQVAAFLGGVSYPMYLNHWIGAFAANWVFGLFAMRGTMLNKVTSVILALGVAGVLFLMVDRTVMNNRSRFFTVARGKFAALAGFTLVVLGLFGGIFFF